MVHGIRQPSPVSPIFLRSVVDRVVEEWLDDFDLSEQSVRRIIEIAQRFVDFSDAAGGDADLAAQSERFVHALVDGVDEAREPSIATKHLRRAALRLLFRTARSLDLLDGDPTLDLTLPPRTSLKVRALTDEEVALCRSFSVHSLTETRLPAAWALAEATARTSELPHITCSDVDLDNGRVWLHGSSKAETRWGFLTSWGLTHIHRRVDTIADKSLPLIYMGNGRPESKQSASCIAIAETLTRAGLGLEPDVRPGSVVAWAGQHILQESGHIEEVARRLGIRSLDRAAKFIDFDWTRSSGSEN